MIREEIIVREAIGKDSKEIAKMLSSTTLDNEEWGGKHEFVAENLKGKNFIFLVAEVASSIVGFVDCAVFASFWEGQKQGLIVDFFVLPAYQGRGVGSKLLSALVQKAEREKIEELHVSTGWVNRKARRLYGKFGFTEEQLLLERSKTSGGSNV